MGGGVVKRLYLFLVVILFIFTVRGSNEKALMKNKLSTGAVSNFSYAHIQLTDESYEYRVVPHLGGLQEEFYNLLQVHHLYFNRIQNLRPLVAKVRNLLGREVPLRINCNQLPLNELENYLHELDQGVYHWMKGLITAQSLSNDFFALDSSLFFFFQTLFTAQMRVTHLQLSSEKKCQDWDSLRSSLREIQLAYEQLLIKGLPTELQEDYLALWNHFLRILFVKIIPEKNRSLFVARLEGLNFAWNYFMRRVTKERKDVPQGELMIVQSMHNRWNGMLRTIFD